MRDPIRHNLRVFNTLSRRKEKFTSISPRKVKMFVCGPTVQNYTHVGHARTYVFYDVIARYLGHLGYEVDFVMNITDADDKVIDVAERRGVSLETVADKYTAAFLRDMKGLDLTTIKRYEKASKYIPQIIEQIKALLERKFAYKVDRNIFFDVKSFKEFGGLSHQSRRELELRPIEISPLKRNPNDFALWRSVDRAEIHWDSPWGPGRPGWHIQDTAITNTIFGPTYDIHGGADELIYPHHEAQIAEAESLTGVKPFVRYWIHTGMVTLDGVKMSKSRMNVVNIRDLLKKYTTSELRFYLLTRHYRKNFDFDESDLRRSADNYRSTQEKAKKLQGSLYGGKRETLAGAASAIYAALENDFDTPLALYRIRKAVSEGLVGGANTAQGGARSITLASQLLGIDFLESD